MLTHNYQQEYVNGSSHIKVSINNLQLFKGMLQYFFCILYSSGKQNKLC